AGADVVGVDEEGGVGAHGGHLCAERLLLVGEQEGEGVGGGPHRGDAPGAAGFEVARGLEAGDVGGAGCGHGGAFAGAAGSHLGEGAAVGGGHHPGGGA